MTLRLAQRPTTKVCPVCDGRGWERNPVTYGVRCTDSMGRPAMQYGNGHPIPCSHCRGRKVVVA